MLTINFKNMGTATIALVLVVLVMFLGKETKKSIIPAIMLIVFSLVMITHSVLLTVADASQTQYISELTKTVAIDIVFVFLSFLIYLWVDEMEAKIKKRKTISSGLDWFWKNV